MSISQRILSGSITRGTQVINLGVEGDLNNDYSTSDAYIRDGWNIVERKNYRGITQYLKSNASDTVLFNGKVIGEKFDDMTSTTVGNNIVYFGEKKQTSILSHAMEKRDLGYSQPLEGNDYFECTNPDDPIEIIGTHPYELYLPSTMVDFSSALVIDGVIDPLEVRSKADRSNLESPFHSRGIRGSFSNETPFRRTALIHEGYNLKDSPTVPYLDAPEYFGNVELPPIFQEDNMKFTPFTDTNSALELYFPKKELEGYAVSSDIISVLTSGSSFDTADMNEFDIYGRRGTDYFGGGTDSIAFGGLLK